MLRHTDENENWVTLTYLSRLGVTGYGRLVFSRPRYIKLTFAVFWPLSGDRLAIKRRVDRRRRSFVGQHV